MYTHFTFENGSSIYRRIQKLDTDLMALRWTPEDIQLYAQEAGLEEISAHDAAVLDRFLRALFKDSSFFDTRLAHLFGSVEDILQVHKKGEAYTPEETASIRAATTRFATGLSEKSFESAWRSVNDHLSITTRVIGNRENPASLSSEQLSESTQAFLDKVSELFQERNVLIRNYVEDHIRPMVGRYSTLDDLMGRDTYEGPER